MNILTILPRILAISALALPSSSAEPPAWAPPIVNRVRNTAFLELSKAPIHIKELQSASDFFRARPRLLDFFLLEKAFYEIEYELAHRPDWLRVPLAGTWRILSRSQGTPQ